MNSFAFRDRGIRLNYNRRGDCARYGCIVPCLPCACLATPQTLTRIFTALRGPHAAHRAQHSCARRAHMHGAQMGERAVCRDCRLPPAPSSKYRHYIPHYIHHNIHRTLCVERCAAKICALQTNEDNMPLPATPRATAFARMSARIARCVCIQEDTVRTRGGMLLALACFALCYTAAKAEEKAQRPKRQPALCAGDFGGWFSFAVGIQAG